MKIEVNNIYQLYKKNNYVLNNINMCIESPSMIGLVGPNGAGKTTLMKLLTGELMASKGSIIVDDFNLNKNERYLKSKLGYLPQNFGLYDELTVEQFLDYMACLKGIKENKKEIIKNCIMETNLQDKQKDKIATLSGGQKQRVGIAQALLNNPELFIVDEPTVGLDPEERIKFRNLFSRNASDNNKIVILSTHIIDDVQSICNRLIVMNKGFILFDGIPNQLIMQAQGHTMQLEIKDSSHQLKEDGFKITSRMIIPEGVRYRLVGDKFPNGSRTIIPSLEDAYVYCMMKKEEAIKNV